MLTYDLRRRDVDWSKLKALTEEWRRTTESGYFYGDYYPLTPYNRDETQWIAWQFHRPDRGTGIVQAFRRKDCLSGSACFALDGLDSAAEYVVTDIDAPERAGTFTGRQLMEDGVSVETGVAPQAAILTYERKRQ
ncbi:GH36 C-terminal domain-containing protein [Verrucomicrobiota bacterium]